MLQYDSISSTLLLYVLLLLSRNQIRWEHTIITNYQDCSETYSPISGKPFFGEAEISRRSLGLPRRTDSFLFRLLPLQLWAITSDACGKRQDKRACTVIRPFPSRGWWLHHGIVRIHMWSVDDLNLLEYQLNWSAVRKGSGAFDITWALLAIEVVVEPVCGGDS